MGLLTRFRESSAMRCVQASIQQAKPLEDGVAAMRRLSDFGTERSVPILREAIFKDNTALQITSSLATGVSVDTNANDDSSLESGIGIDGDGGLDTNGDGYVDANNYPTGYRAFYLMKYELTQGQWVSFFNTLSDVEKATARCLSPNLSSRCLPIAECCLAAPYCLATWAL